MNKDFSKYYTPETISSALINLLSFQDNCKVVDICCGSGNLLNAAKKNNNNIICHGVDISEKAGHLDIDLAICDGRDYAIHHMGEFDVALANPPFGYSDSKQFADQLFCDKYDSISSSRLEIEMLVANLLILKDSGVLLIILPTTVVEGASMVNIRKILAKNHSLYAIIDLPINAFAPEKIKCSALIIKKAPNFCEYTKLYIMDSSYAIHKQKNISLSCILEGNWNGDISLNNYFDFVIKQGTISSQMFSENGVEVLHTGRKTVEWQPTIRLANIPSDKNCIMAEKGDIIISRIGASAGQKCVYQGDPRFVSDCLLIIKSPSLELVQKIFRLDLTTIVSGLSTPHVTAKNIYSMYKKSIVKE